jgi:hypothetical protein
MQCRLIRPMNRTPTDDDQRDLLPAGEVIDHVDAFQLVRIGCAESFDEECAAAVQRTPEQLAEAREAYNRVDKGIWPEDYEMFNAGIIAGYNPDGSYMPGPNWEDREQDEPEDEEEPEDVE